MSVDAQRKRAIQRELTSVFPNKQPFAKANSVATKILARSGRCNDFAKFFRDFEGIVGGTAEEAVSYFSTASRIAAA